VALDQARAQMTEPRKPGRPPRGTPVTQLARLTIVLDDDIAMRLKIEAVRRRTSVGKLIEILVKMHLKDDAGNT
jgi:hypothetical protein